MSRRQASSTISTEIDDVDKREQGSTVAENTKDLETLNDDFHSGKEDNSKDSKETELTANIKDMSVGANAGNTEEGDRSSLPRKPRRLFTGIKKKDAKHCGDKTDNNKASSPKNKTAYMQTKKSKNASPKKKDTPQSYKRQFFDDDHPYEDPSLLANNSTTLHSIKKPSMCEEQVTSPVASVKSSENEKENHSSIMSETSIPRSIFASLVALLLSLIAFLAIYFLLRSHAVLSVAIAILIYVTIFTVLGFMDGKRMKCLILLFLPSVCSRGGRLALYLIISYFVIAGPLCNIIANVQTVRNVLKCRHNERPDVLEETSIAFRAAQLCITNTQLNLAKANESIGVGCVQQRCFSVKDRFEEKCAANDDRIPRTVCNISQELSCVNQTRSTTSCPKNFPNKYCRGEFNKILEFLQGETRDKDSCSFFDIFKMLFPLLILFTLSESYKYENNYRTYNNFHNFFLTNHFQVIDLSRSSCDRAAVLPLRKVELRKHVRPATVLHLTDIEKKHLWSNFKTYVVFLLIVLFVILADLYMFRMFDLKNEEKVGPELVSSNNSQSFPDVNQAVARNNESVTNKNIKSNITDLKVNTTSAPEITPKPPVQTADPCAANLDAPGSTSKITLPAVLTLLLLVILFDAYVSRIKWYICSRLYEMREKERVFYLYNKILEDRLQLVERCKERMKCYHREMKSLNSLEITRVLAEQAGWLSTIFNFFHINLKRCIICNDAEKPEFKICHGQDCSAVYCLTCSFDIDKKCLYCDTELKHSLALKLQNGKDLSSKESLV